MKILYYCEEYHCHHGGRTHAREFFAALPQVPVITYTEVMPDERELQQDRPSNQARPIGKMRFLPRSTRNFIRCFLPRIDLAQDIENRVQRKNIDFLLIRTFYQRNLMLGRLKRQLPNTIIGVEINAAYFDENFPNIWLKSFWQYIEVQRYKLADAIIVVSSYLKDYLVGWGVPEDKICVNQNGVNPEHFRLSQIKREVLRNKYAIPLDAFVLGYVGGMESFRRLPDVIETFAAMRRKGNTKLFLLLVGDGNDMPAVKAVIEKNKDVLQNAISCLGWQRYAVVPEIMSTFDIAIMPFTNPYCSPLKLFEYLAMGIPTVGPDTPAVREVVQDRVHLRLVSQQEPLFEEIIEELQQSADLRESLAKEGQRYILENYTWEKNAERVIRHLAHVRAKKMEAAARDRITASSSE